MAQCKKSKIITIIGTMNSTYRSIMYLDVYYFLGAKNDVIVPFVLFTDRFGGLSRVLFNPFLLFASSLRVPPVLHSWKIPVLLTFGDVTQGNVAVASNAAVDVGPFVD